MTAGAILSALISYLIVIDPVGVSIIFAVLARGKDDDYCRRMAIRSIAFSTILVLCFGFFGSWLLGRLGIAMESFRIAGGLLLFYTAFNMVTKPDKNNSGQGDDAPEDISVFPLSIPLIAGPGCLTLTILLFPNAATSMRETIALVCVVLLALMLTLFCLLSAKKLSIMIGPTINNLLNRLLGVLLAALSIQFIVDGIKGFAK